MFCKYCGNEIADDSVFCSKCGKNIKEENSNSSFPAKNAAIGENNVKENNAVEKQGSAPQEEGASSDSSAKNTANAKDTVEKQSSASIDETINKAVDSVSNKIEKTNHLCIAGLVLTVIMFFFNTYGIVGFAALVLSFLGYKAARKNEQKGMMLAIICMAVAGITSLIFVIRLIEYQRYESAMYGGLGGLFDLLGDL